MENTQFKSGFTFLEILIATTIFAVMMVLTMGVLGQNAGYQTKLKTTRSVTSEAKEISDMITRETRKAGQDGTINLKGEKNDFRNGILLLECSASCSSPTVSSDNANTLVLSDDSFYQIFTSNSFGTENILYYQKVDKSNLTDGILEESQLFDTVSDRFIYSKNDVKLSFSGFSDLKREPRQQPYVAFSVFVRTKDYDKLEPNFRFEYMIRSAITSRSYNN